MKQGKKARAKLTSRINGWMASQKMQKDVAAFRKPGSLK
jgi:hypothetical protein